jgi:hypothetical protein
MDNRFVPSGKLKLAAVQQPARSLNLFCGFAPQCRVTQKPEAEMREKLFALSLGFGVLILVTQVQGMDMTIAVAVDAAGGRADRGVAQRP